MHVCRSPPAARQLTPHAPTHPTDLQVNVRCNNKPGIFYLPERSIECGCPVCERVPARDRLFTPYMFRKHTGGKTSDWRRAIR
jgi:hypothetical protein